MNKEEQKNKKNQIKNTSNYIMYIVLIIIIILCLLSFKKCSSDKQEPLITPPTNVDIFKIKCDDGSCIIDNKDKEDKPKDKTVDKQVPETPNEVEVEIDEGSVVVEDKYITWKSENELNIFSNPKYNYNSVIAPEDSNEYEFIVYNNTIYNIKYDIKFIETNEYGMNLKYKLKRGNEYLAGDENNWVSYDELNINDGNINVSENDHYNLEWKWVSSDNDALVGNISANYKLKIEINAEEIE